MQCRQGGMPALVRALVQLVCGMHTGHGVLRAQRSALMGLTCCDQGLPQARGEADLHVKAQAQAQAQARVSTDARQPGSHLNQGGGERTKWV